MDSKPNEVIHTWETTVDMVKDLLVGCEPYAEVHDINVSKLQDALSEWNKEYEEYSNEEWTTRFTRFSLLDGEGKPITFPVRFVSETKIIPPAPLDRD